MATIPERTDKNNKTFQGRIVQKHDTEANWKKATNFVPLKGEIIIYDDLRKIKIGDGSTKVNELDFISDEYIPISGNTEILGNKYVTDPSGFEVGLYPGIGAVISGLDMENGVLAFKNDDSSGGYSRINLTCYRTNDGSIFYEAPEIRTTIGNILDPVADDDVATKKYVDNNISSTTIVTWTDDGT